MDVSTTKTVFNFANNRLCLPTLNPIFLLLVKTNRPELWKSQFFLTFLCAIQKKFQNKSDFSAFLLNNYREAFLCWKLSKTLSILHSRKSNSRFALSKLKTVLRFPSSSTHIMTRTKSLFNFFLKNVYHSFDDEDGCAQN